MTTTSPLLTLAEAAEYLRVARSTLYMWRHEFARKGEGPVSVKIGSRVMYRRADVDAYIASRVPASPRLRAVR